VTRRKPTKAEFGTFWSVFEAKQARKKNRTIPPSNFITEQDQNHDER